MSALKNACVITWKMPITNAPTPQAMNMKPGCETVEYASTFLMSFCVIPIVAAKIAVAAPTSATTRSIVCECWKITLVRVTMYKPAVTIVAAWINADTGVGPAIASGNQTCSGSCADFPQAPIKSPSAIQDKTPQCPSNSSG